MAYGAARDAAGNVVSGGPRDVAGNMVGGAPRSLANGAAWLRRPVAPAAAPGTPGGGSWRDRRRRG